MAIGDNQPHLQHSGLVVEWRHDHLIDDAEYDNAYYPENSVADVSFDADDYDDIYPNELNDLHHVTPDFFNVPPAAVVAAPQGTFIDDDTEVDPDSDHDDDDYYDNDNDNDPDPVFDNVFQEGAPKVAADE